MTNFTDEFYPGSKQKMKQYGKNYKSPAFEEPEDMTLGRSREFMLGTKRVKLYPVGELAQALGRKPVTIRKWENEGIIPQSIYWSPSEDPRGVRRLYTEEQIRGLRKIADEEGILRPNANGKWPPVEGTSFRNKALKLFQELEK